KLTIVCNGISSLCFVLGILPQQHLSTLFPYTTLFRSIKVSEPFGREGLDGLFANRQVLQAAFSTEVLEEGANSTAIELDPETTRSEEHTSELQSRFDLVCRLLLENKKYQTHRKSNVNE